MSLFGDLAQDAFGKWQAAFSQSVLAALGKIGATPATSATVKVPLTKFTVTIPVGVSPTTQTVTVTTTISVPNDALPVTDTITTTLPGSTGETTITALASLVEKGPSIKPPAPDRQSLTFATLPPILSTLPPTSSACTFENGATVSHNAADLRIILPLIFIIVALLAGYIVIWFRIKRKHAPRRVFLGSGQIEDNEGAEETQVADPLDQGHRPWGDYVDGRLAGPNRRATSASPSSMRRQINQAPSVIQRFKTIAAVAKLRIGEYGKRGALEDRAHGYGWGLGKRKEEPGVIERSIFDPAPVYSE